MALARALAPGPAILIADEPTGNLDESTGAEVIDLLFAGHEQRGTTLVLVTHDAALARRCDRVVRSALGSHRDAQARGGELMGIRRASVMLLALRFAVRELRGGVRGFYVFIACIALGVMAIAGIGSLASGLADGLAREGRVIFGGDAAFALSLREASPTEHRFLDNQGILSIAATMRAMARASDGRTALVELKAVYDAYPLYGAVGLEPSQPLAQALARHDGVFGAAADPALLLRLDLGPGSRIMIGSATIEIAPASHRSPTSSQEASVSARDCSSAKRRYAQPGCCSPAAW